MSDPGRKKVLILTYYWPPSGGAGVQRWLKFTKYMREFNFEPVIYTAKDPEYPSIDESLHHDVPPGLEVLKTRVWEPYKLYKWFTFQKKGYRINAGFLNENKRKGLAEKISVWIRGNWFIPDARKFWIKPSVRYLTRYLKKNPVSLIVSTGPPHSLHLIALGIAKKMQISWVADFRDPWTNIDYYQELRLGRRADRKHRELEKKVLQSANAVTVISQDMKRQFEEMGFSNLKVIRNGFDPDDFAFADDHGSAGFRSGEAQSGKRKPGMEQPAEARDREFSLIHIGTIVPTRNPEILWKVLSELISENTDFANDLSVKLVGAMDYSVSKSLEEAGLWNRVTHIEYLPHREAIGMLKRSRVLLLLINKTPNARGILTGKLFEYMSANRPILAIGPPEGEAAQVLKETGTGFMVNFNDRDHLKKLILELYRQHREDELDSKAQNIDAYTRKNLTREMIDLFNKILPHT